jgi:hypothetical protein
MQGFALCTNKCGVSVFFDWAQLGTPIKHRLVVIEIAVEQHHKYRGTDWLGSGCVVMSARCKTNSEIGVSCF